MNPKQKLSFMPVALLLPNLLLLLYLSIGRHRLQKWLIWPWLACGLIGVVGMILYIYRHPELRQAPQDRAMRTPAMNTRGTILRAMIVLAVCLAIDLLVLSERDPPRILFRRRGVAAYAQWNIVHVGAWVSLLAAFVILVALGQAWYRKPKSESFGQQDTFK
jgi:hypothetical protein